MLAPKHVKHRREFYGKVRDETKGGKTIALGEYGLETVEPHWITNRQIEAARTTMAHFMRRGGRVWIRISPQRPHTTKDVSVHMGLGKGAPADWITTVKRDRIVFGISGVSEDVAREALRFASDKFPVKIKFAKKSSEVGGESNEG